MQRRAAWGAIALAAIALAYALPLQSVGCAQTSHYANIKALAAGSPTIDRWAGETCDLVRRNGHYYAAKAPLLDLLATPWYLLLHATGAVPANRFPHAGYPAAMAGIKPRALWQLGLLVVVLPALALLLLVRRTADRIEPGTGVAVAAILGLGTLVLPFSTLLFAHVLATSLAFAAFVSLFRTSRRPALAAGLAGVAAGLAVSADVPLVVPAALLFVYALARRPRLSRGLAYAAGGAVGLVPLLVYNAWAFGSPFHLSYSGVAVNPGAGGQELAPGHHGFFTIGAPSPRVALELLFSGRGLFVLTPVLALALAGAVVLFRRGLRAEATLVVGLLVAELLWNSGHGSGDLPTALGGWVPGPRFLIPTLPFLAIAIAPILRRLPLTTAALAAVSIGAMTLATAAEPLLSNDDTRHWVHRVTGGNFAPTLFSLAGIGHGWLAILPFLALVLVAVLAAGSTWPRRATRGDATLAGAVSVAWILVEHAAPTLLRIDREVGKAWGALAVVALVVALAVALWRTAGGHLMALVLAAPLLAFATVRFDKHTKWALLLGLAVALALAAWPRVGGRLRRRPIPA